MLGEEGRGLALFAKLSTFVHLLARVGALTGLSQVR